MPDVKEVYEMVTKQKPPQPGALERQLGRQRRAGRNRKVGAIAVAAALVVGLVTIALVSDPGRSGLPRNNVSPPVPINATPPIGAQIVALDGTVLQQLPPAVVADSGFAVSPDGQTVAFYDAGKVETARLDGTEVRVLTEPSTGGGDGCCTISWSPDGSRIAYARNDEIFVMNADGSDQRQLTHSPAGSGSYWPAWSPMSDTIAFWRGSFTPDDGGPSDAEIYTIPASGGAATRLTQDNVPSIEPAWSPDGSQIVYRRSRKQDLVVMQADGTNAHRLPGRVQNPWAPSWSRDGTKIAYLACCTEVGSPPLLEVQVFDLHTRTVQRLHMDVATDGGGPAVWLDDGRLLVERYD